MQCSLAQMGTIGHKLHLAWDHVSTKKLTPIVTFLFGGAVVGSMSNVFPLYIASGAALLGGLLACWIYISDRPLWFSLSLIWVGSVATLWIVYFRPTIISDNIARAETALAANNFQCIDLGRKQALEDLARYGVKLISLEIDCANIDGISFPRNAVIQNISIADGRAVAGKFIGTDMWGAILSPISQMLNLRMLRSEEPYSDAIIYTSTGKLDRAAATKVQT
jgi:hypothetical protein